MVLIRRVLGGALFVGLLVSGWSFAARNGAPVSVDFILGVTPPQPLWLIVLLAAGAGLGVAGLYLGLALLRDRVEIARLRRAVHRLEAELRDYRNEPVESALTGVIDGPARDLPDPDATAPTPAAGGR